jgi:hypothetical protein
MFGRHNKNSAHDRSIRTGDTMGGPDPAGREDILSPPGTEPHLGRDILGGPDAPGPEDELTASGRGPARPAAHDILGGPDRPGPEDIMGPPRDA